MVLLRRGEFITRQIELEVFGRRFAALDDALDPFYDPLVQVIDGPGGQETLVDPRLPAEDAFSPTWWVNRAPCLRHRFTRQ